MDRRVLQQVGKLKVPESWREKTEYRQMKKEIYSFKLQEDCLLKHLKAIRNEVTTIINKLQRIVGFPELKYADISLETLKHLKAECFSEKVTTVTDLNHSLEAMGIRLQQL